MKRCARCGEEVCATCCQNLRRLARNDARKFYVCDYCDTELDNFDLRHTFDARMQPLINEVHRIDASLEELKDNSKQGESHGVADLG